MIDLSSLIKFASANYYVFFMLGLFFMTAIFALIAIMAFKSRKELSGMLKSVGGKTLLVLFFIFLLALAIRLSLPDRAYYLWTDESCMLEQGKIYSNMVSFSGNLKSSCYSLHLPGWPYIVSLVFLIFGNSAEAGFLASILIGSLTVLPIFLIGYLLFKSRFIGLSAAFLFSLIPSHITHSATAGNYAPSLFFVALSIALFLFYIQNRNFFSFGMFIFSCSIALSFRVENIILVPLFVIAGFIFNLKPNFRIENIAVVILAAFLIIPSGMIALDMYGDPGRIVKAFNGINSNNEVAQAAESKSMQENLVYNSINYGIHVFDNFFHPALFSVFFVFGVLLMLRYRPKEAIFLLCWLLLLWLILFSSYFQYNGNTTDALMKDRFYISFYPVTILFASFFIFIIGEIKLKKLNLNLKFAKLAFPYLRAIALTALFVAFIPYTFSWDGYNSGIRGVYTQITNSLEKDVPEGCTVVMKSPEVFNAVHGSTALTLSDFYKLSSASSSKDLNFDSECYVFFDDYGCFIANITGSKGDLCAKLKADFNLFKIKEYPRFESDNNYTAAIYRIDGVKK